MAAPGAGAIVCEFAFDITCPYAFLASTRVPEVERHNPGVLIRYVPVLLGALYELSQAPQGKAGSATDAQPPARRAVGAADFEREVRRHGVTELKFPANHPVKSVDALRLICATPDSHRARLVAALFRAYWIEGLNISQGPVLLRIARNVGLRDVISLNDSLFAVTEDADPLRANTQRFHELGAFGVPVFRIEGRDRIWWGADRLALFEAELLAVRLGRPLEFVAINLVQSDLDSRVQHIERLLPRTLRTPPEQRPRTLTVWLDLSSPWSYLAWTQMERVQRETGPSLRIAVKPVLVGALFKSIGTPTIPMSAYSPMKISYMRQDLEDWSTFWAAVGSQELPPIEAPRFRWPDKFPIHSALPLRVVILEPATIDCLFRAAWRDNVQIDQPELLASTLSAAGFDGKALVAAASTGERADAARQTLRANVDEAVKLGLCGVPSFQLGQHTVFGQDRLPVVQDLLSGWRPDVSTLVAKVGGSRFHDYRL